MPAKKILFIENPCAGQRRVAKRLSDILEIFCAENWLPTVLATQYAGHACELAQTYAKDFDTIVCAGGDGTLNEVLSGLTDAGLSIPLGYIPCGTTNDFASTLNLSKEPDQAARDIVNGKPFPMDLGKFNQRYFVYTASFGAFTRVSYSTPQLAKNTLGHLAYLLEGVKNLGTIKPIHAKIHTDQGDFCGDYIFGSVSNTTSLAGILTLDKTMVQLDDGKFELLLVDMPENPLEMSQLLLNIAQKRYEAPIHLVSVKDIQFESTEEVEWTLDGEYEKGGTTAEIHNIHRAAQILVNR